MSRSRGRVKDTPVDPAKSAWVPPYGPSIRATQVGVNVGSGSCWVFGGELTAYGSAALKRRCVKPLCPFRMKTSWLSFDEGTDAMVAGWD